MKNECRAKFCHHKKDLLIPELTQGSRTEHEGAERQFWAIFAVILWIFL